MPSNSRVKSAVQQNYKRPESILVVVHTAEGLVLLLKRADIGDFWQSVTGSLRWGESAREAAVRELREETGIPAGDDLVDWRHTARFEILEKFKPRYAPHTNTNLEHLFSLQVDADRPIVINPHEHIAFQWRHHTEALDILWSWSNRDAVQAVAARYWPN